MNKVLGISLGVLALAIAIVPNFTDCFSHGHLMATVSGVQVPMACHWSGRAEIAVGVPLFAVGAAMMFTTRKSGLLALSILGIALGALAIVLPTNIIGTCASDFWSVCTIGSVPATPTPPTKLSTAFATCGAGGGVRPERRPPE